MRESTYQRNLIRKLKGMFPGCFILKNDPTFVQGVPDILILYHDKWAMLEVKMDITSNVQPNQQYYVDKLGEMSFASFINPSTEEEVLNELQFALRPRRETRVS
jgi:hypothetical protein